jgi:hypothetical protein
MKIMITAFSCMFALTVSAHAQNATQDAKLRAAMSASAYASFTTAIRDARDRGLPTEPLIAKALEGAAKSVPGDRIVIAVRQTSDRMVRAQVILRASRPTTSDEIVAVSDALQRSVPEDALRRIVSDSAGRASVALSAHAFADLVGHGVPVAVGLEVIGAWRNGGADAARLKEIPVAIERLVRQGVAPARAGAGVAAGLRLGRPLSGITPDNIKL